MLLLGIFQTVEFYIITAFIAAAVVAYAAMPSERGAARTFLYGGTLSNPADGASAAGIVLMVNDKGLVEIYRFGIEGVSESGAYSLAVRIAGFDVTIEERLVAGRRGGEPMTAGHAVLDCFGPERYHFQYRSGSTNTTAAFYLTVRPGARVDRRLMP